MSNKISLLLIGINNFGLPIDAIAQGNLYLDTWSIFNSLLRSEKSIFVVNIFP